MPSGFNAGAGQTNPWGNLLDTENPFAQDNAIATNRYGAPIYNNPFGPMEAAQIDPFVNNPELATSVLADTRNWRTDGTGFLLNPINEYIAPGLEMLYNFMNPAGSTGDQRYNDYMAFGDSIMGGYTGGANPFAQAAGVNNSNSWLGTDGFRNLVRDMYSGNYDVAWDGATKGADMNAARNFANTLMAGAFQGMTGNRLEQFERQLGLEVMEWQKAAAGTSQELSFRDWILFNSTLLSDFGIL